MTPRNPDERTGAFASRVLRFAWLSVIRQPARTLLGVLGVAAVGALLFDMLLLSRGLVLSFRDLLDRAGYDVRVFATDSPPLSGTDIGDAAGAARDIRALPEVDTVLVVRIRSAELASDTQPSNGATGDAESRRGRTRRRVEFVAVEAGSRPLWTLVEGAELPRESGPVAAVVVNRSVARQLGARPGTRIALRGRCAAGGAALPPVTLSVSGIADFPFDTAASLTVAGTLDGLERLCGEGARSSADMLMVRSPPGSAAGLTAAAIRRVRPELHVATNDDLVERFSRVEFSYFRQISVVLATVTLFFGFLLIAVLFTVSVNQRLGEIAALRALGLSRGRVVAGVLCESIVLVGAGGLLALPIGVLISVWLDRILRTLPGIPEDLHFFVFEPRALVLHGVLLAVAAAAAAAYPMRIVATLPIAGTLRREVVS
jgi:putative ABC transport system permease protein